MITIFGGSTSRSLRVVWLAEEMGLPYRVRPVDMLSDVPDEEFLAANPAGYIPVLQDGDVTMVESIGIMEYLMARHGPTPLQVATDDPAFPAYQQFLHLGEAGLATLMMIIIMCRHFAPESERQNWAIGQSERWIEGRRKLVRRQLERGPWMSGDSFTAADISVSYGLHLGQKAAGLTLEPIEQAYLDRALDRGAYRRALEASNAVFTAPSV